MARPVDLPRRARLAVNATLAMAGAQVRLVWTMTYMNYLKNDPFQQWKVFLIF
jgi:hypothetical protein